MIYAGFVVGVVLTSVFWGWVYMPYMTLPPLDPPWHCEWDGDN